MTLQISAQLKYQLEVKEKKRCVYDGKEILRYGERGNGKLKDSCNRYCHQQHYMFIRKLTGIIEQFNFTPKNQRTEIQTNKYNYAKFVFQSVESGMPSILFVENMRSVIGSFSIIPKMVCFEGSWINISNTKKSQ